METSKSIKRLSNMDTSNTKKIDRILQFSLLTAGQEDFGSRELGPIHLIKYLYLADLEYAKKQGNTYTGIPWTFHHFGPWDYGAFSRIEPALQAIGAQKKTIDPLQSTYGKEFTRWLAVNEKLYDMLERDLPIIIRGTIQKYVHKFNAVTEDLLHYVYTTWPILNAKPGELLNFVPPDYMKKIKKQDCEQNNDDTKALSVRQQKKKKQALQLLRSEFRKKLEAKKQKPKIRFAPPPYDDIYFDGLKVLDSLAGKGIKQTEGVASFSDDIWKSKARFDPEIP